MGACLFGARERTCPLAPRWPSTAGSEGWMVEILSSRQRSATRWATSIGCRLLCSRASSGGSRTTTSRTGASRPRGEMPASATPSSVHRQRCRTASCVSTFEGSWGICSRRCKHSRPRMERFWWRSCSRRKTPGCSERCPSGGDGQLGAACTISGLSSIPRTCAPSFGFSICSVSRPSAILGTRPSSSLSSSTNPLTHGCRRSPTAAGTIRGGYLLREQNHGGGREM